MIRNHKAVSIMMALVFCLSMLAPIFVAPQAADAMATGSATTVPTVLSNGTEQTLGTVTLQDAGTALKNAQIQVILPSGVEYANTPTVASSASYLNIPAYIGGKENILTAMTVTINSASTSKLLVLDVAGYAYDDVNQVAGFSLLFNAAGASKCTVSASGDILLGFTSNNSSVPVGMTVLCAKVGNAGTINTVLDKLNVASGNDQVLGGLEVMENVAGAMASGATFELIFPEGVTFVDCDITSSAPFQGVSHSAATEDSSGNSKVIFTVNQYNATTSAGFIMISNILVDIADDVANGDVVVQLRSTGTAASVTDGDYTIGVKGDYTIAVSASEAPVINNGLYDVKCASIFLKETIGGSLIEDRSISFELPENARWVDIPTITVKSGGITITRPNDTVAKTNDRKITYTVTTGSTSATEIEFKNGTIALEADGAVGDVVVTVSGTATAEGTAIIAKAQAPVTATVDPLNDIIIGLQNQAASNLVITEANAGAIKASISSNTAYLELQLPDGVKWAAKPTVEVTTGNLKLDTQNVYKSGSIVTIPVKTSSTTASVITISGISLTSDRTVPEGPLEIDITGTGLDRTSFFLNEAGDRDTDEMNRTAAFCDIANCVTPAPTETVAEYSGSFTLGSTIYYVNGMAKIMDVAVFAQDGRVFVPQRFLGIALGIPNDETHILWDDATQTATFVNAAGKEAKCSVGSKVLTFDGVETQMDVEPIVSDGRIFLPARFLTEAMGGSVGWDQVTGTALVNIAI